MSLLTCSSFFFGCSFLLLNISCTFTLFGWLTSLFYAYGAAWYSFLNFILLLGAFRSIRFTSPVIIKTREYSKFNEIWLVVSFLLTFFATVLVFSDPPLNGEDKYLKPLLMCLSLYSLAWLYYILFHCRTAPDYDRHLSMLLREHEEKDKHLKVDLDIEKRSTRKLSSPKRGSGKITEPYYGPGTKQRPSGSSSEIANIDEFGSNPNESSSNILPAPTHAESADADIERSKKPNNHFEDDERFDARAEPAGFEKDSDMLKRFDSMGSMRSMISLRSAREGLEFARIREKAAGNLDPQDPTRQCNTDCCYFIREICLFFVLFLIALASAYCILMFVMDTLYFGNLDAQGIALFNSNTDNVLQDVGFRCVGSGDPLVLLFHGYLGQALDFSWVIDGLHNATNSRICSFDRQGIGASKVFGNEPRNSQTFATELAIALSSTTFANNSMNMIFVGHSMANYNMRQFDLMFPGRVKGMVMIEPVNEHTFPAECTDTQSGRVYNPLMDMGLILSQSGILVVLQSLGLTEVFAPITQLPSSIQLEYLFNTWKTDFFKTVKEEGKEFGNDCFMLKEQTNVSFPITLILGDHGLYTNDIDDGKRILDLAPENKGKYYLLEGPLATHAGVFFLKEYADIVTSKIVELIESM